MARAPVILQLYLHPRPEADERPLLFLRALKTIRQPELRRCLADTPAVTRRASRCCGENCATRRSLWSRTTVDADRFMARFRRIANDCRAFVRGLRGDDQAQAEPVPIPQAPHRDRPDARRRLRPARWHSRRLSPCWPRCADVG